MINLNVNESNQFAIYSNTISNEEQSFGDFFLLSLRSSYSNHIAFVIPTVVKRNTRFVQFELTVVQQNEPDDPYNALISLFPPGNYQYRCYNIDTPTLDPSFGILIDEGQAIVGDYTPPEVTETVYVGDNERSLGIVYYSGALDNCIINYANSPYEIISPTVNTCQPLIIEETGFLVIKNGETLTLTSP